MSGYSRPWCPDWLTDDIPAVLEGAPPTGLGSGMNSVLSAGSPFSFTATPEWTPSEPGICGSVRY